MQKVYSKSYSQKGREEHDRIFGKRKAAYENKLLVPAEGEKVKRREFETKEAV